MSNSAGMADLHDLFSSVLSAGSVLAPDGKGIFAEPTANVYWSKQARSLTPSVIVRPKSAQEVAEAIRVIAKSNSNGRRMPFAIRSGGHTTWAGAANVDGGTTLDLRTLNKLVIHPKEGRATIQPGMTWTEAFKELDAAGLAISGGRVGSVGVGGLTLGGGLSYFSPRKGFVCDTVISYELVTAAGEILTVARDTHPDLYLALKGGSNNFGVVTSFDVRTFDQGKVWFGNWYYALDTADSQFKALEEFANSPGYDEYATVMLSHGFKAGKGAAFVATPVYTKEDEKPDTLRAWTEIPNMFTTQRLTTMSDALAEQSSMSSGEYYQCFRTTTIVADKELFKCSYALWESAKSEIEYIAGIVFSVTYHPIPQSTIKASNAAGGNSLGLSDVKQSLIVVLVTATWEEEKDSALVKAAAKKLLDDLDLKAKEIGKAHPFVYLNYADEDQSVMDGYGQQVRERLRKVSSTYDPHGLFQKLCGGGFKVL